MVNFILSAVLNAFPESLVFNFFGISTFFERRFIEIDLTSILMTLNLIRLVFISTIYTFIIFTMISSSFKSFGRPINTRVTGAIAAGWTNGETVLLVQVQGWIGWRLQGLNQLVAEVGFVVGRSVNCVHLFFLFFVFIFLVVALRSN